MRGYKPAPNTQRCTDCCISCFLAKLYEMNRFPRKFQDWTATRLHFPTVWNSTFGALWLQTGFHVYYSKKYLTLMELPTPTHKQTELRRLETSLYPRSPKPLDTQRSPSARYGLGVSAHDALGYIRHTQVQRPPRCPKLLDGAIRKWKVGHETNNSDRPRPSTLRRLYHQTHRALFHLNLIYGSPLPEPNRLRKMFWQMRYPLKS